MLAASETNEALARATAADEVLNLFGDVPADAAVSAAAALDSGPSRGPLHGVPITVKVNLEVAGQSTNQGVPALVDVVAEQDAPLVARLRDAGCVIVGRGNMPEFGLRWHTDNDLFGPTLNPWDRALTPGGSSGGDAAAVAAGVVPLSIGNDYGGSLRVPAAACGVASLKPGFGRVPMVSRTALAPPPFSIQQFAVSGPIASSVAHLRLAFDAMAGPHPEDPFSSSGSIGRTIDGPFRVGVVTDADDRSIVDAVIRAEGVLDDAGMVVERVDLAEVDAGAACWLAIVMDELGRLVIPLIEPMVSDNARTVMHSLFGDPPPGLPTGPEAWVDRRAVALEWSHAFSRFDAILAPVSTIETPTVESELDPGGAVARWRSLRYTVTGNLLGLPAVTWPVFGEDRPTAVQLYGPQGTEGTLLDIAERLEQGLPWQQAPLG